MSNSLFILWSKTFFFCSVNVQRHLQADPHAPDTCTQGMQQVFSSTITSTHSTHKTLLVPQGNILFIATDTFPCCSPLKVPINLIFRFSRGPLDTLVLISSRDWYKTVLQILFYSLDLSKLEKCQLHRQFSFSANKLREDNK